MPRRKPVEEHRHQRHVGERMAADVAVPHVRLALGRADDEEQRNGREQRQEDKGART